MTHKNSANKQNQRLFERGQIRLERENLAESVEVNRGMAILTRDGWEAGQVAAVVADSQSLQVTHVLLGWPRLVLDYRLVPVELIKGVNREVVHLLIDSEAIGTLPPRSRW